MRACCVLRVEGTRYADLNVKQSDIHSCIGNSELLREAENDDEDVLYSGPRSTPRMSRQFTRNMTFDTIDRAGSTNTI